MNTNKAIWFSRHQPTPEQIEDAKRLGFDLAVIPEGMVLGAMSLNDDGDTRAVVTALLGICSKTDAKAIFGVFPTPILCQIHRTAQDAVQRGQNTPQGEGIGDVPCFASWNVQRSQEGGKPTFQHKAWLPIGHLSQGSLRWLP